MVGGFHESSLVSRSLCVVSLFPGHSYIPISHRNHRSVFWGSAVENLSSRTKRGICISWTLSRSMLGTAMVSSRGKSMAHAIAIGGLLLSSALSLWAKNDAIKARDARLIQQVQEIPVSQLDPALPSLSF